MAYLGKGDWGERLGWQKASYGKRISQLEIDGDERRMSWANMPCLAKRNTSEMYGNEKLDI